MNRRALAALLILAAAPALADIVPYGAYSKVTGTGENRDGYQLLLWRDGGTLLGRFVAWQSGEKQSGDFIHGLLDDNGIYFTVPLKEESSPSAKPITMGLKAKVVKDHLNGVLWWDAERARVGDDDAGEKISWPADRTIKLGSFKNLTQWKDAAEKTE